MDYYGEERILFFKEEKRPKKLDSLDAKKEERS